MSYQWRFDLVLHHLSFLLQGVGATLGVCLISFGAAMVIGLVAALLRLSRIRPLRLISQIYVDLIRSTPLLIQLVWIFYALPLLTGWSLSVMETGVVALSLYGGAYLSEVFRSGINTIDQGQLGAAQAIGLRSDQMWRRIILPQALAIMLPPLPAPSLRSSKSRRCCRSSAYPN